MIVLDRKYTIRELYEIDYLKEQRGSKEIDMWGFNQPVARKPVNGWNMIPLSISITINFMVFHMVEWEY